MNKIDKKPEIVKGLLSDIRLGIILGLILSLYDVSLTVMTYYRHFIFQRPLSVISLFSAAIINYLLICVPAMLGMAVVWQILRRMPWRPFQKLNRPVFYLTTFLTAPLGLLILAFLWNRILPWLPVTSGLVMTYIVCVFFATLCGWLILYQILRLIAFCLSRIKFFSLFKRRFVIPAVLLLPMVFFIIAIVMALLKPCSADLQDRGFSAKSFTNETNDVIVQRSPEAGKLPNILFISIECLRADHVNRCGYQDRLTTPFLDELSQKGVLFTHTFTQASWTKPSMASIFSSQYLENHHVNVGQGLAKGTATLPGILRSMGYQTCSIYANPNLVDPAFGFEDIYASGNLIDDSDYISPVLPFRLLVSRVSFPLKLDRILPKFPSDYKHWWVDAKRMNRAAVEWMKKCTKDRPIFLHIHYNEPHGPYFDHPPKTIVLDLPVGWNRKTFIRRYDSEIRFVDEAISDLTSVFSDFSKGGNTLTVITGDHGQEFMEHNHYGHAKTLFDEVTRVPLILAYPGKLPEDRIITSDIQSIDIAPTILDILDISVPDSFQGRSLLTLVDGTETASRVVHSRHESGLANYDAIRENNFKLIRTEGLNGLIQRDFLYDLKKDPAEAHNIIDEKSEIAKSLMEKMADRKARIDTGSQQKPIRKEYTHQEKRILKSLGDLQ